MVSRRHVIIGGGAVASAALMPGYAWAQAEWPVQPITINIGNAPGGDDDTLSRFLAESMGAELGQPVVVENKPGGSTTVAATAVTSAAPDGYNLMCIIAPTVVQTVLRDNLPFTLDSFTPIIKIGTYPLALLVSATAGIDSLEKLIELAKTGDGVTFASGGVGTVGHLTCTIFLKEIGGNGVHVSYKNNPEGIQALAGGFTQMMIVSGREAGLLKDDPNVKVLAVTTAERASNLPDTPTMTEVGYPQIAGRVWYGYVGPAGLDAAVVEKLATAIRNGVESPVFQERFSPLSFQTELVEGDEFKQFLVSEAERYGKVIEENDIRVDG